jgi:CRP-like cAMP-binding protein
MTNGELEFRHGETIIKQGDTTHGFYILLSGAVEVYKDDILLTVLMFPGTIFGEMADILGKPRTCTVKAKNQAKLTLVPQANMEHLIRDQPEIAMKIMKTLAIRLERMTQKMADQYKESPMWSVEGVKKPLG